jgi:hypothetical protein
VEEGVRRVNRSLAIALVIGVIAVLGAEIGGELAWRFAPGELGNYIVQLSATFIGALLAVAIGLTLFDFQSRDIDKRRSRQLYEAMVGELQATLDVLQQRPTHRADPPPGAPEGAEALAVVVTHLEPVACEESIRSAILGPSDVFSLSHLASAMRSYNIAARRLESVYWGPAVTNYAALLYDVMLEVEHYQNSVIQWSTTNIEGLAKDLQIDVPPRFYSKDISADQADNS